MGGPGSGYELFWGSGGHGGPYKDMKAVKKEVDNQWKAEREDYIHVHRRDAAGLGGYWYIGSYRLKKNGERVWPRPIAEWWIGRDRDWNRKPQSRLG